MKSLDRVTLKTFVFGLPFVFIFAIFLTTFAPAQLHGGGVIGALNTLGGVLIGGWMSLSIYLSLRLLFSRELRAEVLPKLVLFKERDEREVLIAAKAARNSFLTTLALLIFLLCISAFQVAIYRVPAEQAINGKNGMISLGMNIGLSQKSTLASEGTTDYVRYDGLPISNSAIVLFLILWQLGSYNYFARRTGRDEDLLLT